MPGLFFWAARLRARRADFVIGISHRKNFFGKSLKKGLTFYPECGIIIMSGGEQNL
jgi:hypothetical protein